MLTNTTRNVYQLTTENSGRSKGDRVKRGGEKEDLYSAFIVVPHTHGTINILFIAQYLTPKALRYGSHSVICKLHRNCLYLVSVHQTAPPQTEVVDI